MVRTRGQDPIAGRMIAAVLRLLTAMNATDGGVSMRAHTGIRVSALIGGSAALISGHARTVSR
jgi:hypothetical protein